MGYMDKYREWMEKLPENDPLREELKAIEGDHRAIRERFQLDLSFGTAGLRGIVSAGTNRMNFYTVGRATQGIANFIITFSAIDTKAAGSTIFIICLNS